MPEKYYIVAILGKRTKNNQLTKEGCSRCDKFLEMLEERSLKPDLILPTGGKRRGNESHTEATLAWSYLVSNGVPEDMIAVEIEAQNTIDNFSLLLKKLKSRGIELSDVEIAIISTDYHIDRIKRIKDLMPDTDILLNSLKRVGKCECWSVPYCYASDPDELKRWRGSLYVASDNLRIYGTMLESIVKGKSTQIYPDVARMYPEFLHEFMDGLIMRRPESSDQQKRKQEDEIIDKVYAVAQSLENYYHTNLEGLSSNSLPSQTSAIGIHYNFLKINHESMSRDVDPDE